MKKKILGVSLSLILVFLMVLVNIFLDNKTLLEPIFAMTVDGIETNTLDSTKNYYLTSYTCQGTTKLKWNYTNQTLDVSGNTTAQERCYLTFESAPFLTKMKVGDYVSYTANNGCNAVNTCFGKNVNDADETGVSGFCGTADYKYLYTGWRIAYIDSGKAYLISAGAPECLARNSTAGNSDFITAANNLALKYCNTSYTTACDNTAVWAMRDQDFSKITLGISYTSSHLNSYYGSNSCNNISSSYTCGYADDMLDIGGYYWFAASTDATATSGILWDAATRKIITSTSTDAYGVRIIVTLNASVKVTGGKGSMTNPYTISPN